MLDLAKSAQEIICIENWSRTVEALFVSHHCSCVADSALSHVTETECTEVNVLISCWKIVQIFRCWIKVHHLTCNLINSCAFSKSDTEYQFKCTATLELLLQAVIYLTHKHRTNIMQELWTIACRPVTERSSRFSSVAYASTLLKEQHEQTI